jgi:hypothetical protein
MNFNAFQSRKFDAMPLSKKKALVKEFWIYSSFDYGSDYDKKKIY